MAPGSKPATPSLIRELISLHEEQAWGFGIRKTASPEGKAA